MRSSAVLVVVVLAWCQVCVQSCEIVGVRECTFPRLQHPAEWCLQRRLHQDCCVSGTVTYLEKRDVDL